MKKYIFTAFLFLLFISSYCQEKKEIQNFKRNELKINAPFLVAGALEIDYEKLLNDESGVGVSVFLGLDNEIDKKFSVAPYYRFYFGKKPAAGFFVDGFGMFNISKPEPYLYSYYDPALGYYNYKSAPETTITDFALGFSIGAKWITKRGFTFELKSGIGRNLFDKKNDFYNNEIVFNGGLNIGYRF